MELELTNKPMVVLAIERATIQPINTSPLVQWLDSQNKQGSTLVNRLAYQAFGMLSNDGSYIYHVFKYNGDKTQLPGRVQTVDGVELVFNGIIPNIMDTADIVGFEKALLKTTTAPNWLYVLANDYLTDSEWVKLSRDSEMFTDLLNGVHPLKRFEIVERVTNYVKRLCINSTTDNKYTLIVSMLEPFIDEPLNDKEKAFIWHHAS